MHPRNNLTPSVETCRLRKNTRNFEADNLTPCGTRDAFPALIHRLTPPISMKQYEAPFCTLRHVVRPGFHEAFANRRRQNGRIMSQKCRAPAASTKCKRWPPNDLRAAVRTSRKQNTKNPERQCLLSHVVANRPNKIGSAVHGLSALHPVQPLRLERLCERPSTQPAQPPVGQIRACRTTPIYGKMVDSRLGSRFDS
jgi:hypothetical protein